ncbi:MAG: hypothetical protein JWQ24_3035 [Tardiphaga sp.]|nr:hypothetical protein [Tardiphaga sp.]
MQTSVFARKIADAVDDQTLIQTLPLKQYGGKSGLKVRPVGDGTLIEIRARAKTAEAALRIVEAAANLAIEQENVSYGPLKSLLVGRGTTLKQERGEILKVLASAQSLVTNDGGAQVLPTIASLRERLQALDDGIWQIEVAQVVPLAQPPEIFAAPSILKPVIGQWWIASLLGAFCAGVLAFAVLLFMKRSASA